MNVNNKKLNTLKHLREVAFAHLQRQKKEFKLAEDLFRFRDDLLNYYEKGWDAHLKRLVDENIIQLNELRKKHPKETKIIDEIFSNAKVTTLERLRRFPAYFEEACNKAAIDIDHTSRHPRYRVCYKFIEVEVLENSQDVRIFDREGQLERLPCDIEAVIRSIDQHRKRLFERKFDAQQFLKRLYRQYQYILKKENHQDGYALPIRRITSRLGKNVKGFRTDEFLIDLSRIIKEGKVKIEGFILDLQQTKDDRKGMLLHELESRGYIGFVLFRKEMNT